MSDTGEGDEMNKLLDAAAIGLMVLFFASILVAYVFTVILSFTSGQYVVGCILASVVLFCWAAHRSGCIIVRHPREVDE